MNQKFTFRPNIYKMSLRELTEYADEFFSERGYFVPEGQGETKAQQLCTCVCKILYRYWNDWDLYNKWYGRETCWYAARWIKKNCFKFKAENNYERTLKNILIETLNIIDKYENTPTEWNIYES